QSGNRTILHPSFCIPCPTEGGLRLSSNQKSKIKNPKSLHAFTMIEIAICLGVIGFALVAIIGILPTGMSVQKDNRQETIINQDASVLMEAIRNGAQGVDDLTNYVAAITNYWVDWKDATVQNKHNDGYTYTNSDAS